MFVNKRLSSSELVNYILGQVVGARISQVFFPGYNPGMSTASLGEMAWQTASLVFGGFFA